MTTPVEQSGAAGPNLDAGLADEIVEANPTASSPTTTSEDSSLRSPSIPTPADVQVASTEALVEHSVSQSTGPAQTLPVGSPLSGNDDSIAPAVTPDSVVDTNTVEKGPNIFPLPKSKAKSAWRQWLAEICYCVVSLCSFIVIVVVLRTYEGRSLPKLPMDITLNTFLAFFATFSKAAFCTVLTEALSQWKWNITNPDPVNKNGGYVSKVSDFELVDKASRGPWGSWLLIWSVKWRHFITGAALLSLISNFTSPITQQLISYPVRIAPTDGEASVSYVREFGETPGGSTRGQALIDAVNVASFASIESNHVDHAPASCSTSKCTFDLYSSLAICVKAANVSHLLEIHELKNTTYKDWTAAGEHTQLESLFRESAQEEERLDSPKEAPVITSTAWNASLPRVNISFVTPVSLALLYTARVESLAFEDSYNNNFTTFLRTYFIWSSAGNVSYPGYNRTNDTKPWTFEAVEFIYHLCVNTYNTTYENGTSQTRIVSSSNVPLAIPDSLPPDDATCDYGPMPLRTWEQRCRFRSPRSEVVKGLGYTYLADPASPQSSSSPYRFDRGIAGRLVLTLNQALSGFWYWSGLSLSVASFDPLGSSTLAVLLFHSRNREEWGYNAEKQLKAIYPYFEGFAIGLSNAMRTAPNASIENKGVVYGQENWVKINWGWVSFLAAEILLSYIFLAATVYRTIRLGTPVLKSSELATILASTEGLSNAVGSVNNMDEAVERSKGVTMNLQDGRLVVGSVDVRGRV
ncbi:hypothetical protein OQA88_969 [Cercophora sp. LCS_1]